MSLAARRPWIALPLGIAALLLVALAALGLVRALSAVGLGGPDAAIPTLRVEPSRFQLAVQAEGVLRAAEAQPILVPSSLPGTGRIAWLAPDGSRVKAGEVVVRFDPTELEKERDSAQANLERNRLQRQTHRAETETSLSNLERNTEVAQLEEELAQRFETEDEEIYSRSEIIASQIDGQLAIERRRHAEDARVLEESLSRIREDLLGLSQQATEIELARARQGLASLEIRAPFDGIFVLSRSWRGETVKLGDSIWPGFKLGEIPDLSTLQAEVYVLEADAGALAEGRPAQVTVEASPSEFHSARILRVGKLAQQRQRASPVQYFSVLLGLDEGSAASLSPGQRVRAELYLADLAEALVVPRQAIFERQGKSVVFRRPAAGAAFEAVPVRLGASAPGRVVVESGLAPGDVIALADPEAAPEIEAEPGEDPGPGAPETKVAPGVAAPGSRR